ncbi:MetQ/NlpA family ABC transporter substrate-binding protein [Sutterella wadsworthensis]|mgnify:FL=1|uniref:MetQ/NlpA family ABC transporter substrate-binding protein n=1 Tax=Sutterella wadsworthensis TaxID=40545 RepID=UPI001D082A32|nr:MetQ/NlpA family ABC transporter substrate-binding protein [Sutterella wadsworthensis]MCB7456182.1 MetQ/NlpA family ABC transporter substrate-binding protein [Sutterella wadsworthensis]
MQLKKLFAALAVSGGLVFTLAGCGDKAPAEKAAAPAQTAAVELKIGVSPVPHADIINFVAPTLEKEGVKVKVIEFNDYVQPNLALSEKELDANFFQHKPYLDTFSKEHKLNLAVLAAVHLEPMGVYSKSIKNVADLPDGAKIAVPNDPTNGGRALKVLETAGILKVRPEAGILASPADIVDNPKHVKIVEVEAAQLPRALDDVDAAVINSNYALAAKLNPTKDAIAIESKDSPYANVVVVRAGDENRPELQKLKNALLTPEVKKFLEEKYQGAVVPAF